MSQEHPLVTDFLNYLRFERHFSPHTGKCYAADLYQFSQFLVGGPTAAAQASVTTKRSTPAGYGIGGGTAVATVPAAIGMKRRHGTTSTKASGRRCESDPLVSHVPHGTGVFKGHGGSKARDASQLLQVLSAAQLYFRRTPSPPSELPSRKTPAEVPGS